MKRRLALLIASALSLTVPAQSRTVRSINDGWIFTKEGQSVKVDIPHCINAHDTWDEEPGYYRGLCTYERKVRINDDLTGRKVYVRFEGAGQECELIVNGRSLGKHAGSYTAFIFDATDAVVPGDNDFLIRLDNTYNPDIPPLDADFTFYGGIYRDVELVLTPENHICNTFHASSGVFITTPKVGGTSSVHVRTLLDVVPGTYKVLQELFDAEGNMVASSSRKVKKAAECVQDFDVAGCRLWDICDPYVYRLRTSLCDSRGRVLDQVTNPLGFRTYSFDPEKGFTLNGRQLKLMGTNRHQDYLDRGNALSDEMHVRDVMLLKEMGGNFLRIAHYPQDPVVTQMCDRLGIVCSVEIPVINFITESDAFRDNCVEMAREMVCQDFNSPSVLIWAYMNEVMLHPPYNRREESPERDRYDRAMYECARAVDDAIRELDPMRPTMIPMDSANPLYKRTGLSGIPDILGYNHYQGWYSKVFSDFEDVVRKAHEDFPDKPMIITEYGAGIDPRIHSRKPRRLDFSNEYGMMFHKHYIDVIRETPYISGSNVWNLNDFYAEARIDAVPHVNNKGLVGLDRTPKDVYLLYQASLLKEPFVGVAGRTWTLRGGNEGEEFTQEVYTNSGSVTLFHNGRLVGSAPAENHVASFSITPVDGWNTVSARSSDGVEDFVRFRYEAVPADMSRFTQLSVSLGTDCEFEDDVQGLAWIPEQEYVPGSWGYVGGEQFSLKSHWTGALPGTNMDILGTVNNPLFQTQRIGIEAFKADVPDGRYYVYLYFAELATDSTGKILPYNLGNDVEAAGATDRVFDVLINGDVVLKDYDIRAEHGENRAAIRKITVDVTAGKGLDVTFLASKAEPVLNAIRIYRCQ